MSARRPHSLLDLLFLPLRCLMQIPPLAPGIIALVALAIGGYFYYTTNSDFGGLARPAFQNNEDIYRQLLGLRAWDNVTITGREILKIE